MDLTLKKIETNDKEKERNMQSDLLHKKKRIQQNYQNAELIERRMVKKLCLLI